MFVSELIVPKGRQIIHESDRGVCIWQVPSGGYIRDADFNYLSMEGPLHNHIIERKMREAAKTFTGSTDGKPVWFPGRRKISDMEYEDQMERLIDGKTPDITEGIQ